VVAALLNTLDCELPHRESDRPSESTSVRKAMQTADTPPL
jgi:hypothetical protein